VGGVLDDIASFPARKGRTRRLSSSPQNTKRAGAISPAARRVARGVIWKRFGKIFDLFEGRCGERGEAESVTADAARPGRGGISRPPQIPFYLKMKK